MAELDRLRKPLIFKSPEIVCTPGVGLTEPRIRTSLLMADEELIRKTLKEMGFSDHAVEAFMSGKVISSVEQETPLGISRNEDWIGKEKDTSGDKSSLSKSDTGS